MAIRYDKKLNQEINRTLNNFNSKIKRLEKSKRDLILPEKQNRKQLLENVETRSELNRKLKELQLYSKRGIEKTVESGTQTSISEYELILLKKEAQRLKSRVTRELTKLENTNIEIAGKKQNITFSKNADIRYLNLLARKKALNKNIKNLGKEDLKNYKKLLAKTSYNFSRTKQELFKENYLTMLLDSGYLGGYDKEKLNEIRFKLNELSTDEFMKIFEKDKAIQDIISYYPSKTNTGFKLDYSLIQDDIANLYDAIYNNLDKIISSA